MWTARSAALLSILVCADAASALASPLHTLVERTPLALTPAQAEQSAPGERFRGVGVVKAIDAATGSLTLDHEEIKGLMPAMEMMYRVEPRSLSDGLRPGDRIHFSLDAKTYTIEEVQVIQPAK